MYKRELIGKQKQVYIAHIKSNDYYKYYKSQYMKIKGKLIPQSSIYHLTYSKYIEIIETYNLLIRNKLLYESKQVHLPYRLGALTVKKFKNELKINKRGKPIGYPINWKATNALWESDPKAYEQKKFIRIMNDHSKGYAASLTWDKSNCNVPNQCKYAFIPCRTINVLLKDIMNDEDSNIDYVLAK